MTNRVRRLGVSAQGLKSPENAAERMTKYQLLWRDKSTRLGAAILCVLTLLAVGAPLLGLPDPTGQEIAAAFQWPSAAHWFGTDEFGRDLLSRVVWGARPALLVGFLSVLVSLLIGVPVGMFAGLKGGRVDLIICALVDVLMSFPSLLLALMIVTLAGAGVHILILAIGIAHIPVFVRLARSSTMQLRSLDYVAISRSLGASDRWIITQHILPNIIGPIIVMATLGIAGAIRDEAALSFLGLGVQPPNPSWGNVIREGVSAILTAPWIALIAGFVLAISVLAFNLIGDAVRDVLDPRDLTGKSLERGGRK